MPRRDSNSSSTSVTKSQSMTIESENSALGKTLPRIVATRQNSAQSDQSPSPSTAPSVGRDGSYSPPRSVRRDSDRRSSYFVEQDHCNLDSEREGGTPSNIESMRDRRLRMGITEQQRDFQNHARQSSSTGYSDEKDEIKAAFLRGTFDLTERLMHEKRSVPTSCNSRGTSVNRRTSATFREGLCDDLDRSSANDTGNNFSGNLTIPVNSSNSVNFPSANSTGNTPLNNLDRLSPTPPIRRQSASKSGYNAAKASSEYSPNLSSSSSSASVSASTSVSYKSPFSSDSLASFRRPLNTGNTGYTGNTGPYSCSSSSSSSRTVSPEKNCFSSLSPDRNCFSLVTAQSQPILLQPLRENER